MIRATPLGDRSEEQTVRRIAALARLELSAQEVEVFGAQLASVLAAFESLAGAPVDHVAPPSAPGSRAPR